VRVSFNKSERGRVFLVVYGVFVIVYIGSF